ncbi:hypothetical protein CBR_g37937 [Chara braunii]|uniref:DUF659 domain-containing protein n=1 Tax=Chara braunii TaxID=69332 RepID=A0A388LPC6_CHABU|nr:hypothetical protein CBR_g37937 [Chara braunii]|eukprot:GBG84062.1 hypothetical protein CBR_g37937 [Chara braunii]
MIQLYRLENNITVGVDQTPKTDTARAAKPDTLGEFMQPPTAPGREEVSGGGDWTGGVTDNQGTMREGGETPAVPSGDGSVTGRGTGVFKQASIRRWTENSSQQRLDIAWGMHLYEHGAPFNYVIGEKTYELHELYLELGEKRQRVKMPNRMQMATVVLDIAYERTQEAMKPLMECWDINGCTLIIDGSTDRKFRPVMNFIAAGESGAVMLKVVDMSKRKKNAVSLAKLWEGVIREIGVQRVNALCTDNAEVNKHAAITLRRRTDNNISRIPWVSCAAHCLNLLLKGICEEPWVQELHKRGKTIVKCIENHHKTAQLFDCSEMERSRTLTMPMEVHFASVYMMLERLLDRRKVLKAMMKEGWLNIKWAARKKRERAETVYRTVRSDEWWEEVEAAVDVMTPVYDLLRQMDKSGTAPYQLWGFEEALVKKMRTIASISAERQKAIAKKVRRRCKMMRQPVHALNFLLNPAKRDPRWMHDPKSPLVQNAMKFLLSQCSEGATWGCKEHLHLWKSLKTFHKEPEGNSSRPLKDYDSLWTDFAKFDSDLENHTALDWWSCHGKSHDKLQHIAVRVTVMWSTATPCERNWSTLDLVHEKRRNQLSNAPPPLVDPDIVADDGEMSAEEVARRLRLRKTSSARVPKVGKVDESSDTDNSDDGEDLVWRGKGKKRKDVECLDGACHQEGKAEVEEVDDDGDSHEEDEVEEIGTAAFALLAPSDSDEDSDDDPSEDDMTLRQDAVDAVPTLTASGPSTAVGEATGALHAAPSMEEITTAVGATASAEKTGDDSGPTHQQAKNLLADPLGEEELGEGEAPAKRSEVAQVYKRRQQSAASVPPPVLPSELEFPPLVASVQHDNLEMSTMGRKRKVVEPNRSSIKTKEGSG